MDQTLIQELRSCFDGASLEKMTLHVRSAETAEISLQLNDKSLDYTLNPMDELYSEDTPDFENDYHSFEHVFLNALDSVDPEGQLSQASLAKTLEKLSLKPEVNLEKAPDPLTQALTLRATLFLSLNPFSRQDLRKSYRRLSKTIKKYGIHRHGPHCQH